MDILVAEIGSTTTVVNAFDGLGTDHPRFVAQGQAPTSVLDGDVRIGLDHAIRDLKNTLGVKKLVYDKLLATSSAAGGLRMTVHGLVYDMTVKAAKEAALGAGANIHMITAGKLRRTDIKELVQLRPNIILIAGGVDFGERDTAIYNAEKIVGLGLDIPVLYGGNIQNQEEMLEIFTDAGKQDDLYLVDNVYPKIDQLNVEPARKVIQDIFEEHIVKAPGMEHVREMVSGHIIPTPGAVMEASKLLATVLGDLMTIDVGGATTDIHSVAEGSDEISRILISPEPIAKRTVEGDLGMYVNMKNVVSMIGKEALAKKLEISEARLEEWMEHHVPIPVTPDQIRFVEALAEEAIVTSANRHAGGYRTLYGGGGKKTYAEGKDLTSVKYIVGTGGAATRLPHKVALLSKIMDNPLGEKLLPAPEATEILVDHDYIMASLGVLAKEYPETALDLMFQSFRRERPANDTL